MHRRTREETLHNVETCTFQRKWPDENSFALCGLECRLTFVLVHTPVRVVPMVQDAVFIPARIGLAGIVHCGEEAKVLSRMSPALLDHLLVLKGLNMSACDWFFQC